MRVKVCLAHVQKIQCVSLFSAAAAVLVRVDQGGIPQNYELPEISVDLDRDVKEFGNFMPLSSRRALLKILAEDCCHFKFGVWPPDELLLACLAKLLTVYKNLREPALPGETSEPQLRDVSCSKILHANAFGMIWKASHLLVTLQTTWFEGLSLAIKAHRRNMQRTKRATYVEYKKVCKPRGNRWSYCERDASGAVIRGPNKPGEEEEGRDPTLAARIKTQALREWMEVRHPMIR